jgi:hypothetical protein
MTDALSSLVRVGLRNPVRVVVKVEAKRGTKRKAEDEVVSERRVPATYVSWFDTYSLPNIFFLFVSQPTEFLFRM